MVVLLIVAIIAAASAPMITKKMAKGAVNGDSPWVFTSLRGDLAYNTNGGDRSVIIGASNYNANGAGPANPRLVLATEDNQPGLVFANPNGNFRGMLNQSGSITAWNTANGNNNATPGNNSLAIGTNQTIDKVNNSNSSPATGVVALGDGVHSGGNNSITIGHLADTSHDPTITDMNGSNSTGQTIAIGDRARACKWGAIAIGPFYENLSTRAARAASIAIGQGARAHAHSSIAIGERANAQVDNATQEVGSIAIGPRSNATKHCATAVGTSAQATGKTATAIGHGAIASGDWSTAIGVDAKATKSNQITLGTANDTVYIPGRLVVDQRAVLGWNSNEVTMIRAGGEDSTTTHLMSVQVNNNDWHFDGRCGDSPDLELYTSMERQNGDTYVQALEYATAIQNFYKAIFSYHGDNEEPYPYGKLIRWENLSDRRLKNVGEKYTAGLAELKKLDFFHYTFKKDEAKRPHVGVIAQDLEQVFPDSVTKGEDGYLRIRWDEMFYAVINAVKELDSRITAITENVKANFDKIAKLEETISEQQKTIEELKAQNEIYEKQFELMEKRLSKVERGKGVKG